jgi:hypothetical protein
MKVDLKPLEAEEPKPHQEPSIGGLPFLLLGRKAPRISGANFGGAAGKPCAAIVLTGGATAADAVAALEAAPDPAVPVADFAGIADIRHDFAAKTLDAEAIDDLRWTCTPIWERLAALPFQGSTEDRDDLTFLRLAYSRDTPIKASFDVNSQLLVRYPLLGAGPATQQRLEALASLDLLNRRHFARTHACGKCGSARLHVYEACPACGSAHLSEEPLVHHYRCGWQEPESKFLADRMLVCPKCHRELRHYGVDYGKPGNVSICRGCGASNAEPKPLFKCIDCNAETATAEAPERDWYHYELTEEGLRALQLGRMPRFDFRSLLEGHARALSRREFQLLAVEGMRVARRYQRPFTLARIALVDVKALRGIKRAVDVDAAFRLAVDVIVETLRDSDFVTADTPTSVLLGFPETSAKDASLVVERLHSKIAATIAIPIELTATALDGEAAAELLAEG